MKTDNRQHDARHPARQHALSLAAVALAAAGAAFSFSASGRAGGPTTQIDWTGEARTGIASFYADFFSGRKMADGTRMDPAKNNAASLTLPLGTVAKVTNLETGRSTIVTIRDRGPYVHGRIVDLSPSSARKIGLSRDDGLARVKVAPIALPLPDGRVKAGEGLVEALNSEGR